MSVSGYRPFGLPLEGDGGEPYGYTGEWWEDDAGLLFLRARYMQPGTGRFISRDPWPGIVWRPQTLNKFTYTTNNPASLTDPAGLDAGVTDLCLQDPFQCAATLGALASGGEVAIVTGGIILAGGFIIWNMFANPTTPDVAPPVPHPEPPAIPVPTTIPELYPPPSYPSRRNGNGSKPSETGRPAPQPQPKPVQPPIDPIAPPIPKETARPPATILFHGLNETRLQEFETQGLKISIHLQLLRGPGLYLTPVSDEAIIWAKRAAGQCVDRAWVLEFQIPAHLFAGLTGRKEEPHLDYVIQYGLEWEAVRNIPSLAKGFPANIAPFLPEELRSAVSEHYTYRDYAYGPVEIGTEYVFKSEKAIQDVLRGSRVLLHKVVSETSMKYVRDIIFPRR